MPAQKIRLLTLVFCVVFLLPIKGQKYSLSGIVEDVKTGEKAPAFDIKSGDGRELCLKDIHGKLALVFYETKDQVEINRPLKEALFDYYHAQAPAEKALLKRLPVIDCSSAVWPVTGIWENKLREHSRIEQITIYGDWDGKMAGQYHFSEKLPNTLILDKQGTVRYRQTGKIEKNEIKKILQLLDKLIQE